MYARRVITILLISLVYITDLHSQSSVATARSNGAFVESALYCLRRVRDTKEGALPANKPSTERETKFLFALNLEMSGADIQKHIRPWMRSSNPRIKEGAEHLLSAGNSLIKMAEAYRRILREKGDPDENSAVFRAERDNLDKMMMRTGALASNVDPTKNLLLTRAEKTRIVQLIETQLFRREMEEFDQSDLEVQKSYITIPELFAVLAFRNVYKRELQQ
jgi:hypothetical protein